MSYCPKSPVLNWKHAQRNFENMSCCDCFLHFVSVLNYDSIIFTWLMVLNMLHDRDLMDAENTAFYVSCCVKEVEFKPFRVQQNLNCVIHFIVFRTKLYLWHILGQKTILLKFMCVMLTFIFLFINYLFNFFIILE